MKGEIENEVKIELEEVADKTPAGSAILYL
jgi:hypothetical protein